MMEWEWEGVVVLIDIIIQQQYVELNKQIVKYIYGPCEMTGNFNNY